MPDNGTTAGTLTNPRNIAQLMAAIPITILLGALVGVQIWLNFEEGKEQRQIEREELAEQQKFNQSITKLFTEIAEAEREVADAVALDIQNDSQELEVRRQYLSQMNQQTEVLREIVRALSVKGGCPDW